MLRPSIRHIATLFVVALMTAVNGGVLAFASDLGDTSAGLNSQQTVAQLAVSLIDADRLDACCDGIDEAPQARQNTPTCKAGSSDCGGPLPTVGAISGGSVDLWLSYAATAHRDHLGEHQLRPPRT